MLSSAAFTRRFVSASALAMYAFSSYPIAEPTSDLSLSLAHGADSVELDRRDPFAVNVRAVAARIGIKDPERLSIRVGEQTTGASLGTNATILRRGACVILPAELYEAFHATPAQRQRFDLPDRDEIDFVLAHESAHIVKNHLLVSGVFLPMSLVASCWLIKKIPNKVLATAAGTLALVGSNMLVSWRIEHEADHVAAAHGYARGGIHCFERKLSRNCEMRSALHSRLITKEGNYLGDAAHPLLTSRIQHLQLIADAAATSTVVDNDYSNDHPHHSGCKYCLKV